MTEVEKKSKSPHFPKLWLVFWGILILLNFPLLSIFNNPQFFWNIPLLYFYIFAVWGLSILWTFWIVEKPLKKK